MVWEESRWSEKAIQRYKGLKNSVQVTGALVNISVACTSFAKQAEAYCGIRTHKTFR